MNPLPLETKDDMIRALNKAYDQIICWKDEAVKHKRTLGTVRSILKSNEDDSGKVARLMRLIWPPKDEDR